MEPNKPNIASMTIRPGLAVGAVMAVLILVVCAACGMGLIDAEDLATVVVWMLILAMPFMLVGAALWRSMRRRRQAVVLGYIEEAVRLNLPLPRMMLAAAESEPGRLGRRLMDLQERLAGGEALDEALARAVPEISKGALGTISAAMRVGCLPQALGRLTRRAMPGESRAGSIDGFYRGYVGVVLLAVLVLIGTMVTIVVMPKFRAIMVADGITPPWAMSLFLDFTESYGPMILIGVFVVALFLPLLGRARDYLLWWAPIAGPAMRDKSLGELCDFLVDALELGHPMDTALHQAARAQPNAILRGRARRWADGMAGGLSLRDAARRARMPGLMAAMLNTARGGEDMIQILAFLARHYESRFSRARELLATAAMPAMVFVMGGCVLLMTLAIFQPMIAMVAHFSPNTGGF